jgi:hypothetical protein
LIPCAGCAQGDIGASARETVNIVRTALGLKHAFRAMRPGGLAVDGGMGM